MANGVDVTFAAGDRDFGSQRYTFMLLKRAGNDTVTPMVEDASESRIVAQQDPPAPPTQPLSDPVMSAHWGEVKEALRQLRDAFVGDPTP